MRRLIIIMLLQLVGSAFVFGQTNITVTGKITDSTGSPIGGASVVVTGSKKGTTTDAIGAFTLQAATGQTITITAVGFDPMVVNAAANLDLQLRRNSNVLNEVVVTALGIRREKKALGYAVSTVDKKLLEQRPDGDIGRLLQGKATGVDVLASSGISGSGTNIQIRGANSITGTSDPLWVVDGTPVNGTTNAQTTAIYGNQTSSRFLDIDPNNVESISILKGLSATVLYGETGKNGVILVTTKNGAGKKGNKKMEVSFSQSYFISKPASLPELQSTYGGGFSLTGGFAFFSNWGPKFTDPYTILPHPYTQGVIAGSFPELAGDSVEFRPHDNYGAIFKTGHMLNTSLNVNAAVGNNSSISASYGRLTDQGFLATNKVTRNSFGLGFNTTLQNKFSINGTINYVINDFKSPSTSQAGPSGAASGGLGVFADVMYTPRANDLGTWPYATPDGASAYYRVNNDIPNPLWTMYNSITGQLTNRVFGNVSFKYSILNNLSLMYRVGYDYYNEEHSYKLNKGGVSSSGELEFTRGIYRTVSANNNIWDHSLIAQYNANLTDNIKLDLTGGVNSDVQKFKQSGMKSTDQLVYGLFDHSNFIQHDSKAEDGSDIDYISEQQSIGIYAQAGLSYENYLYLNLGARNSWSSTLESDNRSKFYPSVSVAFIPTSVLKFLENSRTINYLKLRAGYATSASFPLPYQTRPTLTLLTNNFSTRGGTTVNSNTISTTLANPNLKPELLEEFEVGLESRLWNNRITVDFTTYYRKSSDQILSRPLDASTGFETTTINAGDLINKGIELGIGLTAISGKNWRWQIDWNFTKNVSEVQNLPDQISEVQTGGLFSNIGNYAINGQPFGIIKGSYWTRDQKSGQLIVGQDGYYIAATDTRIIGNPNADYRTSIINTVGWKGFEFRMQWDYSKGGVIYANSVNTLLGRGLAKATDVDRTLPIILPGVTQDGLPNTFQTSIDRAYFNTFLGAAEQFLYDATFVRLREMSVSYYLTKDQLGKLPFGSMQFTLSGQNLFHYAPNFPEGSNYDPESSSGGVSKTRGFEFMTGPQSRRWGGTIKLTF